MVWKTGRFVHFAERTGGELANVTVADSIANVSGAKDPCCAVAISHFSYQHCVAAVNSLNGWPGADNQPHHCTMNWKFS